KESTPSADLFLRGWVMCRLPGRNSRSPALRSQSVAPRARESKKSCWRKPPTHWRRPHDGCDHHNCLLLDHFVFLQRNRKRPAVHRYSAIAAKCEAPRAGGFAVESPAQATRTVTGDRSAHHKCGRHSGSALADKPAGSVVRLRRVFVRLGNCASGLSICVVGPPQVAVPTISFSSAGWTCRRPRIRVDFVFAASRTRCATRQAT